MDDRLGIRNFETGIGSGGVGFIIVPTFEDREEHIINCFRTNTVSINGGVGYGDFHGIHCPPYVMQEIQFPTTSKEGTPVVWIRDSISLLPVIVASLRKSGDYYQLQENQKRISVNNGRRNLEVFLDANETELQINVLGDKDYPGKFKIKVNSENEDSEFDLYCDNKLSITSDQELNISTSNKISIEITDKGVIKSTLRYDKGVGLKYSDEFENQISATDGLVEIKSKKINLGEGKEKVVLGDTLVKTLKDLIDAITKITVVTPSGVSGIPINSIQFTVIRNKLNKILSNISNTD